MTVLEKISGIINMLVFDVNCASKDYLNEKVTLEEKNEVISDSKTVAKIRIKTIIETANREIIITLKKERLTPPMIERIKELLNEQL